MKRVKLPHHDTVPDAPELARLVEQARAAREDLIALPFEGVGGGTFVLAVTFSSSKRDIPRWYLFAGEEDGAPLVWVRDTANREEIVLILSGRASRAGFQNEAAKPKAIADGLVQPAAFDQASYYQFYQKLIDPDTGMFPQGAFYWFLSQEMVRYQRTKSAFSLIMLHARQGKNAPDQSTMAWIGQVLTSQMRKLDYVCTLNGNIAVLLAASELSEALACARRLSDLIFEKSNLRNANAPITLYAGVASVPDTCEHPGVLISAAELALKTSIGQSVSVKAFETSMVAVKK